MQHDILQIKGCRSIAKYLCNSLDCRTKHVYIYLHCISLYIRIYLSTRTRCNIAYKVTTSICRIRQRQSCIQARQANGASMGGILFSLPFWVDTLQLWKGQNRFGWFNWWVGPNLFQIEAHMSGNKKSRLWPINANWSHRHAAIHRLVEFNAAWFGCETKLGRGSFGSGPDTPANQTTDD